MAERRMFAKKIISSARFLKMPMETQALYFHLGVNADDDGVVEAYSTMKQVGSSDDSLKLLSAKGFIRVLNDDLVSHVVDWTENNKIRADRKVDSLYKDLLLEIVPNIELIEAKTRADRPTSNGTTMGQPMDGIVEDSIVEDSKGKGRLVEVNTAFESFWESYPKKKSKEQAKKAFNKNFKDMPPIEELLNKIQMLSMTKDWAKEKGQFIPYPATWINAHGWNDEVNLSDSEKATAIVKNSGMSYHDIMVSKGMA